MTCGVSCVQQDRYVLSSMYSPVRSIVLGRSDLSPAQSRRHCSSDFPLQAHCTPYSVEATSLSRPSLVTLASPSSVPSTISTQQASASEPTETQRRGRGATALRSTPYLYYRGAPEDAAGSLAALFEGVLGMRYGGQQKRRRGKASGILVVGVLLHDACWRVCAYLLGTRCSIDCAV